MTVSLECDKDVPTNQIEVGKFRTLSEIPSMFTEKTIDVIGQIGNYDKGEHSEGYRIVYAHIKGKYYWICVVCLLRQAVIAHCWKNSAIWQEISICHDPVKHSPFRSQFAIFQDQFCLEQGKLVSLMH